MSNGGEEGFETELSATGKYNDVSVKSTFFFVNVGMRQMV